MSGVLMGRNYKLLLQKADYYGESPDQSFLEIFKIQLLLEREEG